MDIEERIAVGKVVDIQIAFALEEVASSLGLASSLELAYLRNIVAVDKLACIAVDKKVHTLVVEVVEASSSLVEELVGNTAWRMMVHRFVGKMVRSLQALEVASSSSLEEVAVGNMMLDIQLDTIGVDIVVGKPVVLVLGRFEVAEFAL